MCYRKPRGQLKALHSKLYRDIRFLAVFSGVICLYLVVFWSLEPVGLQCGHLMPSDGILNNSRVMSDLVMTDHCPFKAMGIPKCPFFDRARANLFKNFFYGGVDFSHLYSWAQKPRATWVEETKNLLGFDPLQVQKKTTAESSSRMSHTAALPVAIVLGIMVLTLKLIEKNAG